MIVGIGVDLVEVARIEAMLAAHGERFLARAFTAREQALGQARGATAPTFFAGRWAAKEAVAKALGCGFGPQCGWREVEVANDAAGRPVVELQGAARATAAALGVRQLQVSVSHERHYATAMAVAEGG
jgi:holo-[acyl-carrier protein] synthase